MENLVRDFPAMSCDARRWLAIRGDDVKMIDGEKVASPPSAAARALGIGKRTDPALSASQIIRIVQEHLFDRACEPWNCGAGTRPCRGHEDQAGVDPPLSEPLSGKGAEVLHIVRDDSAALLDRQLEGLSVCASHKIGAPGDGLDVVAAVAEPSGDLGRELLVKKRLHAPSARRPAAMAARPRVYSASLASISSSISLWYSP